MRTALVSLTLAATLGLTALPAPAQDIEPPSRVGRVSLINGSVALYSDPQHGWEKAYVNSPLTSENSLWTEPRGRVEIRIGSTTLRLDETTQLDVRRLGDDELRVSGIVVRGDHDGEIGVVVVVVDADRRECRATSVGFNDILPRWARPAYCAV